MLTAGVILHEQSKDEELTAKAEKMKKLLESISSRTQAAQIDQVCLAGHPMPMPCV